MKWLAAAIGVLIAAIVFWWSRGGSPPVAAPPPMLATAPMPGPLPNPRPGEVPGPDAPPAGRVRRIVPAERAALATAIERARARRTGTDAPASTAPTAAPRLPALDLTPADIRTSVREVAPLLAECFEEALPRLHVHGTKVVAVMQVSGEPDVGTLIDSVELSADDHGLDDPGFRECMHETMMAVALPPMPEGGALEIHYPFVFSDDAADDSDGGLTPVPPPP
jgi:hypothetical protein